MIDRILLPVRDLAYGIGLLLRAVISTPMVLMGLGIGLVVVAAKSQLDKRAIKRVKKGEQEDKAEGCALGEKRDD